MKISIFSQTICPNTNAIINYFNSKNVKIDSVIIEKDIRKKYSKSELKFRDAHDRINRKHKKYSLFRRSLKLVWDKLIPNFFKLKVIQNARYIPFVKKFSSEYIARKNGISVYSVKRHSSELVKDYLINSKCQYVLLASSNWILKKEILAINNCKIISVHPGFLPTYKGLDSMQWTIKDGGTIGNTSFFVDETIDGGDVLKFYPEILKTDDTVVKIQKRMTSRKSEIFLDTILGLLDGSISPSPQTRDIPPLAPMSFDELEEVEKKLKKILPKH